MRKIAAALLTVVLFLSLTAPVSAAEENTAIQSLALAPGENIARVKLTAAESCTLFVALYGGDNRMLDSQMRTVDLGAHTLNVQLSKKAPERFRAKAFLLDEASTPLCESFLLDKTTSSPDPDDHGGKILVAYFSATNTTRPLAKYVADILNADLYEIVPEVPYTADDLKYYTGCRADQEQNDPFARPAISGSVKNMADYDVVFLGYPIWHGQTPKIIYTFLEGYNFTGKTIVPFCTSHSSGIGSSDTNLHALVNGANWLSGRRFGAGTSRDLMAAWIDGLDLLKTPAETAANKIAVSFNGRTYTATLADNSSAQAFAELLRSGPLTISAHDYGKFEKVGPLGTSLPQNNTQITTSPGDIILYQGNQITVYYAQNAWSLTRLGKIDDPSGLREALGGGDVDITFTLQQLRQKGC